MEEKDPRPEIKGQLEALLFVATKTVSAKALARGLDLPEPEAEELLRELAHIWNPATGACAERLTTLAPGDQTRARVSDCRL